MQLAPPERADLTTSSLKQVSAILTSSKSKQILDCQFRDGRDLDVQTRDFPGGVDFRSFYRHRNPDGLIRDNEGIRSILPKPSSQYQSPPQLKPEAPAYSSNARSALLSVYLWLKLLFQNNSPV